MTSRDNNIVDFIFTLFDDSKSFLMSAKTNSIDLELSEKLSRASVLVAWAGFEGWINKTCYDFAESSSDLSVFEKGFLLEKRVEIKNGQFVLQNSDKYETSENKLEFLLKRFANHNLDKQSSHWQNFRESKSLRDSIIHPKKDRKLKVVINDAEKNLKVLQYYLNLLSKKLYRRTHRF